MKKTVVEEIAYTLETGLINGVSLYGTQKLVSSVDTAASNVLPAMIPQEVRTPVVGLALAMIPLLISDHWVAEKISEYTMANAVAQTLALAGNGGKGGPGVIDAAVNKIFDPIAKLGSTAGYVSKQTGGYVGPHATGSYLRTNLRGGMGGLTTEVFARN